MSKQIVTDSSVQSVSKSSILTLPVIVLAAIMAAVYAVLTILSYPIAFGVWQFRLSEAMMLLICLGTVGAACKFKGNNLGISFAIGVTLGCFIANYINPDNLGPVDYIGGTFATALASYLTYLLAKKNSALQAYRNGEISLAGLWKAPSFYILPLPSVLINGAIVGVYLPFLFTPLNEMTVPAFFANIAVFSLCEAAVVYVVGLPLLTALLPLERQFKRI